MNLTRRRKEWSELDQRVFDVVVVGGGINGACLYHYLCAAGYSVLLVDARDFAGATSQASAMMIWGGLLYLRNWDLLTVWRLCAARDRMIRQIEDWVEVRPFRYLPTNGNGRSKRIVQAALYLYWLLGACARRPPRIESRFAEREFLRLGAHDSSLVYEEAVVVPSDARFVLAWLLTHRSAEQKAFNYCSLEDGAFDASARMWHLGVNDRQLGTTYPVRARWVINAAGTWTDTVNKRFGMESPYKHVYSKGVFLGLRKDPRHELPLIFDTRSDGDAMSLIPWGNVSLWGPTERFVADAESGFSVQPEDVRWLLDELNVHLMRPVGPEDVVSLRCGVRPLVVERSFDKDCYPLDVSRKHRVHADQSRPWISIYGGKLTGCVGVAREVCRRLSSTRGRLFVDGGSAREVTPQDRVTFPGVSSDLPSAQWCAKEEMCWTLEDYLRRRTNIAQWVPRGGLGQDNENVPHLADLARAFHNGNVAAAEAGVSSYRSKVEREFDGILARC